jgi:myo-inositol-1(or 4)-monophosphatase
MDLPLDSDLAGDRRTAELLTTIAFRAGAAILRFDCRNVSMRQKADESPVTLADEAAQAVILRGLAADFPGVPIVSEEADRPESPGDMFFLVDPLDGTREFVTGIPEWCVSIGLVVDGEPVAGGICNPATGETILGARGLGVTLNGRPARVSERRTLAGARVLASRSEVKRGEWQRYREDLFEIRPTGSVAYKLALVAAGAVDATWTLSPKHEWDVAAGVALVLAAGGAVAAGSPEELRFNREKPWLSRLVAANPALLPEIERTFLQGTGAAVA